MTTRPSSLACRPERARPFAYGLLTIKCSARRGATWWPSSHHPSSLAHSMWCETHRPHRCSCWDGRLHTYRPRGPDTAAVAVNSCRLQPRAPVSHGCLRAPTPCYSQSRGSGAAHLSLRLWHALLDDTGGLPARRGRRRWAADRRGGARPMPRLCISISIS